MSLPVPQSLAPELACRPAPRDVRRVLLRLPNWLGDVVMAAPTVAAIARALPEAHLTAQVIRPFVPLAALLPGVREAIPAGKDRGLGDLRASRRALREGRYDLAVVFPRGVRAALAPRLAGVRARVGFGGRGKGLLLTHGLHGWKPLRSQHRSLFYGALALPFGEAPREPWALTPPAAALAAADTLLGRLGRRVERPLVALEPGARYGPAKCWPPARFGEVARALLAAGCDVLTVGTAATLPVEEEVAREAGPGLLRAAGKTDDLSALIGLLARARLLLTNDTGPMHLAAALGTPVLALFGATDPRVSAPRGPGPIKIVMDPEPCSPCFLRDCPIPGHPCLTKIGTPRVLREAREMLGERSRPAWRET